MKSSRAVLVIHGGAGTVARSQLDAPREQRYRDALQRILGAGQALLASGASALDIVTEAVRQLEDCPLFNAGRGAVYTADGTHELDACVMDGATLGAGAVAGVRRLRNPVLAARAVMAASGHVLMVGDGAERFALAHGAQAAPPDWFATPERFAQWQYAQRFEAAPLLDHDAAAALARAAAALKVAADVDGADADETAGAPLDERSKFGTVGAVALDVHGHLAAATSTGGLTNKRPGRVGDSPIVGAGCYANDRTVAVSCTGAGENFLRGVAAYDVSALLEYAGLSLAEASRRVVFERLPPIGGSGGLIAVDARGEIALPFNTSGMYRGWVRAEQAPRVAIYRDDDEPAAGA